MIIQYEIGEQCECVEEVASVHGMEVRQSHRFKKEIPNEEFPIL